MPDCCDPVNRVFSVALYTASAVDSCPMRSDAAMIGWAI